MTDSETGELFQESHLCQCWDSPAWHWGLWGLWLLLQASAMPWSLRLCFPRRPGPALRVLPGMCWLNVHSGISNNTDTTESLQSWFCHQLDLPEFPCV